MGENHEKACRFGLHQLRNCSSVEKYQPQVPKRTWGTQSVMGARLLKLQRLDRVQLRSTGGRQGAEDDAYQGRRNQRDNR